MNSSQIAMLMNMRIDEMGENMAEIEVVPGYPGRQKLQKRPPHVKNIEDCLKAPHSPLFKNKRS